jgi:signal transduction histidine kinase
MNGSTTSRAAQESAEELEKRRLQALHSYNLLDTLPEQELDDITRLTSSICQMPISLVTLIDSDRQWFKSKYGMAGSETPRDVAFCNHTIQNPSEIMIVPDAMKDDRFRNNPLTIGDPHVIFYAGVPLVNEDGYALGSLCVIDDKPNALSEVQLQTLKALARQVVGQFELRRANQELEEKRRKLQEAYEDIESFARVVAHDLKGPCTNVYLIAELLKKSGTQQGPEHLQQRLELMSESAMSMSRMVDDILDFAKSSYQQQPLERQDVDLAGLITEICRLNGFPERNVVFEGPVATCSSYRILLKQILLNLIGNALKHSDVEQPMVRISCRDEADFYEVSVEDNGTGMTEETKLRAFELFYTTGQEAAAKAKGHGIGLSTVNTMVKRLGGSVRIDTELDRGTMVRFTMKK